MTLNMEKGWMERAPTIASEDEGVVGEPEEGEEAADVAEEADMIADAI